MRIRPGLIAVLVPLQCMALLELFSPRGIVLDSMTTIPILLMAFFFFASIVKLGDTYDPATVDLIWRCLFAANMGYAVVFAVIMLHPSQCTRNSTGEAFALALRLYYPVLVTRLGLGPSVGRDPGRP